MPTCFQSLEVDFPSEAERLPSGAPSWDFKAVSIALEETLVRTSMRYGCLIVVLILWLGSLAAASVDLTQDLLQAARQGRSGVLQALLASGANVDARNLVGETALMQAAEKGHTEIVEILVGRRVQVNAQDQLGW